MNKRKKKFLGIFSDEERTETIKALAEKVFEEKYWIAEGVELSHSRVDDLKYFILDEAKLEQYKDQFLIFGQATHSGSSYAFFKAPNTTTADEWPIVVLGDEGGAVVIAENIAGLMRFWTLNIVQPYVNSLDYKTFDLFEDDVEEEDIISNDAYCTWIQTEFDLAPVQSIEAAKKEIIEPAMQLFQATIDHIIFDE